MPEQSLLFYCQHSVGLGHLVRSLALADGLAAHFRVVLLSGGPLPDGLAVPPGVEVVGLPPLGHGADYALVSRDPGRSVAAAATERRAQILRTWRQVRAQALVVELFPFGRTKFAGELLPLLDAAAAAPQRPLVVCSLRDILVRDRPNQQEHDDRAAGIANRYLHAVLVHADPRFARLEESFQPSVPLTVPVHHTGFVRPAAPVRPAGDPRPAAPAGPRRLLVSAGGGRVGEPLLRAAAGAAVELHRRAGLLTRLVAGPFLPDEVWRSLSAEVAGRPEVELVRFVPDLAGEIARSAVSLSQCGYNTTMDLLGAGTPAVVVPYAEGREDEQTRRAERLERLGALRVLPADRLDPHRLTEVVLDLLAFRPRPPDLDLDGRQHAAALVADLTARRADLGRAG